MPLPSILSPCDNVRRSCNLLMNDKPCSSVGGVENGARVVSIQNEKLHKLASDIASNIIIDNNTNEKTTSTITTKNLVEWDENIWHYNGNNYTRYSSSNINSSDINWSKLVECQRFERIALYILVLDAINFCFWPCDTIVEYEHLAKALKSIAEIDDDLLLENDNNMTHTMAHNGDESVVVAENSYQLSPHNLIKLTSNDLSNLLHPYLPAPLPNIEERCRLINEIGYGLITYYKGSALHLINQAHQSADTLVSLIIQTFPGFRDHSVATLGRQVFFYKRAQIVVADLWGSLFLAQKSKDKKTSSGGSCELLEHGDTNTNILLQYCSFSDIEKLTTFADYRVPQLLRHYGILKYSDTLENKIDSGEELTSGSMEELYIRAATIVSVDRLLKETCAILSREGMDVPSDQDLNAVKIDWYLWQVGEKLHLEGGVMSFSHRVNTIYY